MDTFIIEEANEDYLIRWCQSPCQFQWSSYSKIIHYIYHSQKLELLWNV